MWNGQYFVVVQNTYEPPYYRYQAIQDGDRAFYYGDTAGALGFYQQVILDENLEWLTQDRWYHDFWTDNAMHNHEPTPTPNPSLQPDPAEYANLAAYAYFRIMLTHVTEGSNCGG